jgi:hypothetical protein
MKWFVRAAVLIISCLAPLTVALVAADAAKSGRPRTERQIKQDEVLRADRELNGALLRGDVAALERLLAKSYTLTYEPEVLLWNDGLPTPTSKTAPGRKVTRDELLASLRSGALMISSLEWIKEGATLAGNPKSALGDKAMVAGRMLEKSALNARDTSGDFVLNRMYAKIDGRWQCTSASANPAVLRE